MQKHQHEASSLQPDGIRHKTVSAWYDATMRYRYVLVQSTFLRNPASCRWAARGRPESSQTKFPRFGLYAVHAKIHNHSESAANF